MSIRAAILVFVFYAAGASARQWYYEPEIYLEGGNDNNPVLLSDESTETPESDIPTEDLRNQNFAIAGGEFRIGSESEDDSLVFALIGAARRYEADILDSERLGASIEYDKATLRGDYSVSTGYSQDSTLETELEDTGQVQNNTNRNEFFLEPSTSFRISEVFTAELDFRYRDITFDRDITSDTESDTFIEFEEFYTVARLERRISNQLDLTGELDYLIYAPTDEVGTGILEESFTSLLLGINYRIDERNSFSLELGSGRRKTDLLAPDGSTSTQLDQNNGVYRFEFEHIGLRSSLAIELGSTYDSSAAGGLTRTERTSIDYSIPLSPRNTFGLAAVYLIRNPIEGEAEEREYFEINPYLTWEASPYLSFTFDILFRDQNLTSTVSNDSTSADSTSFTIGAVYNWGRKLIK